MTSFLFSTADELFTFLKASRVGWGKTSLWRKTSIGVFSTRIYMGKVGHLNVQASNFSYVNSGGLMPMNVLPHMDVLLHSTLIALYL